VSIPMFWSKMLPLL